MKACVLTLGCKTNQFESAALEEQLAGAGYRMVPFEEGADLVIVNTCTVTAKTDAQSRNLIRRARRINPQARVVVTGCYAQVEPDALSRLEGVALVLGNEEKKQLLNELAAAATEETGGRATIRVGDIARVRQAEPLPLYHFADRSRAFVQIQNGCDAFCSYCIIPYARGRSRSVSPEDVVHQVANLVAGGYPEVVLTGIHIGGYGRDLTPATGLTKLVRRLLAETAVGRLRLGSIEPMELEPELIEAMAATPTICPHLHIPLQSGSDTVLQRMGRPYDTAAFRQLIATLDQRIPGIALGLDVIAGFPGETDAEHAATVALLERLPLAFLHVFPYSRRPGTPAARMTDQVPTGVIKARAAELRELGERKTTAFARRFVGRELEVVVLGSGRKGLSAHYLEVMFDPVPGVAPGAIARVRVTEARGGDLCGHLV